MLIRNYKTNKKYLVLGFYHEESKKIYITWDSENCMQGNGTIHLEFERDCEVVNSSYSKYWVENEKKDCLPLDWYKTNFLYELVDNMSPLENKIFKDAKEKIEKEFCYYHLEDRVDTDAEVLSTNWILCPKCSEAFEVTDKQSVIICPNPTCHSELNNPLFTCQGKE